MPWARPGQTPARPGLALIDAQDCGFFAQKAASINTSIMETFCRSRELEVANGNSDSHQAPLTYSPSK
jgi:hypothetical protein